MVLEDGRRPVGEGPDFLCVCLGRHHLHALRREDIRPFMDPQRTHAVLFNADPEEARRLEIPPENLSLAAALLDAVKLQDGDVEITADDPWILMQKDSPALAAMDGISGLGIRAHAVDDARPFLDSLFVSSLISLPIALCNTTRRHFLSFPEGRRIACGIINEGMRVMEKSGRPLARLPAGDPRELMERLKKDPGGFENRRNLPDRSYPPALQAVFRGAQGEAREINKRIVELGASLGLESPLNWRVYQKAGRPLGVGFYRDPAELESALA
jgi:ketopantoate reductase